MRSLAVQRRLRSHPVAAFLLASFAASWAFGLAFLAYVDPVVEFPLSQVASLPYAWAPLGAAAFVGAAVSDSSPTAWVRDAVDLSVSWRWLAAAFLLPVVVQDLPDVALALQGEPVTAGVTPMHALVFAFTFAFGGALEEFGWRGFLQDRLQARWGALAAGVAVGVAWAAWHLPLHVAGYTFADDNLALFTVYLAALAVVMAWVYNSTAGVLPVMVLHAAHNMPSFLAPADGASSPVLDHSLVFVAATWVVLAAVLAAYYGPQRLAADRSARSKREEPPATD
jgi:membrane protease YdiL (CAAX protease family)